MNIAEYSKRFLASAFEARASEKRKELDKQIVDRIIKEFPLSYRGFRLKRAEIQYNGRKGNRVFGDLCDELEEIGRNVNGTIEAIVTLRDFIDKENLSERAKIIIDGFEYVPKAKSIILIRRSKNYANLTIEYSEQFEEKEAKRSLEDNFE